MGNDKKIPFDPFYFQEPLKIDFEKFISGLKPLLPGLAKYNLKLMQDKESPNIKHIGVEGAPGTHIASFLLNEKGNVKQMEFGGGVNTEQEKKLANEVFIELIRKSVIEGQYQAEVCNTTYDSLNAPEKMLYNYYEKFRNVLEQKIDSAKGDKPLLLVAGESHNYKYSPFFVSAAIVISLEKGFKADAYEAPGDHATADSKFKSPGQINYHEILENTESIIQFQQYNSYISKIDKVTPDLYLNKSYAVDLEMTHPLIKKLYELSAEKNEAEIDRLVKLPENMKIRNDNMVSKIIQIQDGDVVFQCGYNHLKGVIEDKKIKDKYNVIPIVLYDGFGDKNSNDIDTKYAMGELQSSEYSFGKPALITDMVPDFPGVLKGGNENRIIDNYLAPLTNESQPEFGIYILLRKFSKVYEDRNCGHLKELEEYIENSVSAKDNTKGVIDKDELQKIKDQIYILQKEFGEAISITEKGKHIDININGIKKGYQLQ